MAIFCCGVQLLRITSDRDPFIAVQLCSKLGRQGTVPFFVYAFRTVDLIHLAHCSVILEDARFDKKASLGAGHYRNPNLEHQRGSFVVFFHIENV